MNAPPPPTQVPQSPGFLNLFQTIDRWWNCSLQANPGILIVKHWYPHLVGNDGIGGELR